MALYHSHFCLLIQQKGALRDKTKQLHGAPIPYELSRLLCRHERCLPTKLEKSFVTKQRNAAQKCMNKTNMPT